MHRTSHSGRVLGHLLLVTFLALPAMTAVSRGEPPVLLLASPPNKSVVRLPDGELCILYMVRGKQCASIRSHDDGQTWGAPRVEFPFARSAGIPVTLVDQDGELHAFLTVRRGSGTKPTVDYFIDIWHARTSRQRQRWLPPKRIFEGYVGALNGVAQLDSGRIVLPHQYWVPGRRSAPPTGSHVVTASYSDDGGRTWQRSPDKLTAPCYADYIGSNYGACEPVLVQLQDGRAWMLMRTQTGFLYESFSQDGVHWSPAAPTRFRASNSPASLLRMDDGRLVVFWNHCQDPSRVDGAPIYTTRDALHVAISHDEGATWLGFREAFRDPRRNASPPTDGDRGTAYPFSTSTCSGKIVLSTGQGAGRGALLRIDPQWIEATHHQDNFSKGLGGWSVYKPFGPVDRYWRDRTQGPRITDHPTLAGAKVLHVRRPDEKAGDEAVWNFPAGIRGTLTLRILLNPGFSGATIALADRFIPPTDPAADALELFQLPIHGAGELPGSAALSFGHWHSLKMCWDLEDRQCVVSVDGAPAATLGLRNRQEGRPSYLRVRSTADGIDRAGLLLERAEVHIAKRAR